MNFLLALLCLAVIRHVDLGLQALEVAENAYIVNVVLGLFNLIPVPPLDGSRIIGVLMDRATYALDPARPVRDADRVRRLLHLPGRVLAADDRRAQEHHRGDGRAGARVKLFWDAGGPYRVAFSTRLGGVSDGSFESLNLGILTADEPQNVVENRTRLCAAVDADPEQATMAWQVHGERVTEADARGIVTPGTPYERCDGLWTDGRAARSCSSPRTAFPSRSLTTGPPRLTVLHVGWRGLLGGIAAEGVAAMAGNGIAAAIGPGIGPCCLRGG